MKSILVKKANQNNLLNFSKKTLLVIMCLCLSFVVWATDYTWTGGGVEGKWDDPDNWGGSGFPSTADNAVISQDVTITAPETGIDLQKITIVENFSLTLGANIKMNVVELLVNTGSSLTIPSGATLYVDRLSSYGTTINDGSIEKHPTGENNKIVVGNGSFINNGTVNQKEFDVTGNASVTNNSNLIIDANITIGNGASLSNSESGRVVSSGTITNSGSLDNNGILTSSGSITNNDTGNILSSGSITTSSSISNNGSITNDGGTISGTVTGNAIELTSYSTITSSSTLNWSDPATWEDQNGDGEGDIPDISGEKEITITLNANVNVDGVSGFFNKGNNKITLAGSKKFYYGGRRAYLSQGNGTGPALDWSTAENWIGGEIPDITGSTPVSILLNGDMEATDQNFSQSDDEKICLFTNGYNLKLNGTTWFGKNSGALNSGKASNLHFYGKGKIYINVLEFGKKASDLLSGYPENKVYLYDGIEIYITDHISPLDTHAEINRDSEESKFYLNASGTNVNWYTDSVNINWIDFEPIPYREQTFFQLFEDGENPISGNSGSGKKITFGRIADDSAKTITFKYKVELINTSGVTWSLGTQTLTDTAGSYTGSVQMTEKAAADVLAKKELYLKSSGPLNPGDGIIITFRTPDDKMDMCEIRYIEGELLWTGASSTDILEPGNWSYNEPLTVDGLTQLLTEKEAVIGSGATKYPVIDNGVEVSKLTLKNGANITVAENGVLTVNKGLSFEGNSKIDARAGKVIFTGTGTAENPSFEATYPEFTSFGTLEVASGATFVTETDLHITKALTNYGTFQAGKIYLEPTGKNITITGQLGDSLDIANKTKISELYCENQADKNLIFNNTIAVDKLVLSGFANTSGSRLTIEDSSGIIYLSNDCFEAYYLFLADSSLPTIKNSFITIFESNTENILDKDAFVDKNWRFRDTDVFIWTGAGLDNNWKNVYNWDSRMVPTVGKTVIIPADCANYPILEENLNLIDINAENSHDSILVAVGASLDFNGKEE